MAYVSVDVDIDLDDLDTDDLVDEVCKRLKRNHRKKLDDEEKEELRESLCDLLKAISLPIIEGIEVKTLDDKMKSEHLASVFHKYSLTQLENLIP